ncbi:MAG: hypothetical protein A2W23_02410 [Planctomycetes bacterium RBG_16_43_13]|nr:MAG: hypothetical protein A2W23_02410 [Planctomycetes bacterium RBG_16_43_13]
MPKYKVDVSLLSDLINEETHGWEYHLNGANFFTNYLLSDKKLRCSSILAKCEDVLAYWYKPPEDRAPDPNYEQVLAVMALGVIGKALFFLDDPIPKSQLRNELRRLANDPKQLIGNFFLFYLVGLLTSQKCKVDFVIEESRPTPDLRISDGPLFYFIEANARQPYRAIDDDVKSQREQIKALLEEKLLKFSDKRYRPGIIAGELSRVISLYNSDGCQCGPKLLRVTNEQLPPGVKIYHLERDAEWSRRGENVNSLLHHVVEEFALQDDKDQIVGIFLAVVRQPYINSTGSRLRFPRTGLLVIDHREDAERYAALSKTIYTVNKAEVRQQLLGNHE